MPCLSGDGRLLEIAKRTLTFLRDPRTIEEAAGFSGLPLFRVRASLREMLEIGYVSLDGELYRTTDAGWEKLKEED